MRFGRCEKCGEKLSSRSQSDIKKFSISYLCQPCFNQPTLEERCIAINNKKKRCMKRNSPKSDNGYCTLHSRMKGNI